MELKENLDQTMRIYKDIIPDLTEPSNAIEICILSIVIKDLISRDLILEEMMGEAMDKGHEKITRGNESQEPRT